MPMKVPDCTPDGRFGIDTSEAGRLGEGAFGVCCLGFHTITQKPVAIKISTRMDVAALEAIVQKRLKHPNVVQLYSAQVSMKEPGVSYLVMECCTGGELFDVIAEHGALHPDAAFRFFCEIISGLAYCHKSGVYHRDLKPENILLSDKGHARIADFGLAKLDQKQGELVNAHSHCGSIYYMAPEVVNQRDEGYDPAAADIWSLGIIYYTMLTGCAPWLKASRSCPEFEYFRRHGLWMPSFVPEGAAEIVCRMLDIKPATRVTSEEVLSMTERLVTSHPLRSLVPTSSYSKPTCGSHSYESGIDFPGEVTIEDIEHICLHRTQALLGERVNSLSSLSTDSDSNGAARPPPTPSRETPHSKPPRPSHSPSQSPQSLATHASLNNDDQPRRWSAPVIPEECGRLPTPQSLHPSPHAEDQQRRWSSPAVPSSSPGFEEAAMSDANTTASESDCCEWCGQDDRNWDGSEYLSAVWNRCPSCGREDEPPGLQEAATRTPRNPRRKDDSPLGSTIRHPVRESENASKAKKVQNPRKPVDERTESWRKIGGDPGDKEEAPEARRRSSNDTGYSSGTGSSWSNGSRSATSCSSSCSSTGCPIEDIGRPAADFCAAEDIQFRVSGSGRSLGTTLPHIGGGERMPPPQLILRGDELPELQSPAENSASFGSWLGGQRNQLGDSPFLRSGARRGLRDSGKIFSPQAPPFPKPCGPQRPVSRGMGATLPPKSPYTDRRQQARGGPEPATPRRAARGRGVSAGPDAGSEGTYSESLLVKCGRYQEGRETTAGGSDTMATRSGSFGGGYRVSEVMVSEVTHIVLSADCLSSSPSPSGQDARQEEGERDSRGEGFESSSPHVRSCDASVSRPEAKQDERREKESATERIDDSWVPGEDPGAGVSRSVAVDEATHARALDAAGESGSCTCVLCGGGCKQHSSEKGMVWGMSPRSCLDGIESPTSQQESGSGSPAETSGTARRAGRRSPLGDGNKEWRDGSSMNGTVLARQRGGGRSGRGICDDCVGRLGEEDVGDCALQREQSSSGASVSPSCNGEDAEDGQRMDVLLERVHRAFGELQVPFLIDKTTHVARSCGAEGGVCVKVCKAGDGYKMEVRRKGVRPQQHHHLYRQLRFKLAGAIAQDNEGLTEIPDIVGIDCGHTPVSPCPGRIRDRRSDSLRVKRLSTQQHC